MEGEPEGRATSGCTPGPRPAALPGALGVPCSCRRRRWRRFSAPLCACVCAPACACVCASACVSVSARGWGCERAVRVRWSPPREGRTQEGRDRGSESGRGCSVPPRGVERKTGKRSCVSLAGTEQRGEFPRGSRGSRRLDALVLAGGVRVWGAPAGAGGRVQRQEAGLLVPAGLPAHPLALAALSSDRCPEPGLE